MADAQEPIAIRRERLLFVEGQGEAIVFGAALRVLSRANDIQIIQCGGKSRMRAVYDAYRLQLEFRSVVSYGVIRDADQNAVGAYQSIRAMLQAAGEPCPS